MRGAGLQLVAELRTAVPPAAVLRSTAVLCSCRPEPESGVCRWAEGRMGWSERSVLGWMSGGSTVKGRNTEFCKLRHMNRTEEKHCFEQLTAPARSSRTT